MFSPFPPPKNNIEHGPFRVDPGGQTLSVFEWSWNRIASVLYLESPAGVGFSYASNSTGTTTDDSTTAADTYTFLKKWFDLYPEYKKNDLYVAGKICLNVETMQVSLMEWGH